jgi:hypothetical protein
VDTSHISKIIWKRALWVKLSTGHSWTCSCADSFSVAKPMSQPWTISQWPRIWQLAIVFPLESIF